MAKIVKTKWNNINGGTDRTDIYPITSDRAVYNADNKTMREIIRVRGVVNISTYFTYDGTPEKLTLETALKKITEENRCPGFLATILTTKDEWWTFRYNAYTVDDDSWNNTDNWSPFHAGWLKTDTTSEDPETPLHLEWVVKNYIYTLKGWIDAVSTERNGYFTAEDYKKFLQALEDIKNLQERMTAAETAISNIQSDITNIKGDINKINDSITDINAAIEELQKLIKTLQDALDNLDMGVTEVRATTDSSLLTASPSSMTKGNVTIKYNVDEDELKKWLKNNDFDPGSVDTGVTSIIASKIGDSETQSILNISPTSRDDNAATGDATIGVGINADELKKWLKNNDFDPGSVDTGVTKLTVTGDDSISVSQDKTTGDINIKLTYLGASPGGGSSNIWFGCAETTLISGFQVRRSVLYPSDEGIVPSVGDLVFMTAVEASSSTSGEYTCKGQGIYYISSINGEFYLLTRYDASMWGFSGGSTSAAADSPNVWIGEGNLNISPYGSIDRSALYPSSDYGTPQVGDTVLWFYINTSGVQTVVIAEVTGVSGSTVSTSTKVSWAIGSGEGGAVDTVQIKHTDDDATNILTINPTDAQSGNVAVGLGISESNLKAWLNNNGFGGGGGSSYPDVNIDQPNPTDIYLTSNQLITGSVSGNLTITFHSTNGVAGAEVQMILKAGSSGATITIAGNYAIVTDDYTTITVGANKYVELNAIYDGSRIYVRSSSKES